MGRLLGEHEATVSRKLQKTRDQIKAAIDAVLATELRLGPDERRACYEQAIQLGRFDIAPLKAGGADAAGRRPSPAGGGAQGFPAHSVPGREMAHPDHDQVIGRLVGARLRGPADRRPGGTAVAEAASGRRDVGRLRRRRPAAGGRGRLDTHLAACAACRRLVAGLAPEVSASADTVAPVAELPAGRTGVVLPFPRKQLFTWMAVAAGLFGAVTVWSVSRLGTEPPPVRMADAAPISPTAESSIPPPAAGSPALTPAPAGGAVPSRQAAAREQDALKKADALRDDAARKRLRVRRSQGGSGVADGGRA